jgi:hypothetical protein
MNADCIIREWLSPRPEELGNNINEFIEILGQPTWITVPGTDRSRCRAISTLLHGNEPSGTFALFHWLKKGEKPPVDIHLFFGNIDAALKTPPFSYRSLPGQRDLNRCFKPPFDDAQGKIARKLLDLLKQHNPDALLDIHNTSGTGPCFAVAINEDAAHKALASLFTQRLVITDLRLGALMELSESEDQIPTVTIECGGSYDHESNCIAQEGLEKYIYQDDVLHYADGDWDMEVLKNPVRLELNAGTIIEYGDKLSSGVDLSLPLDIEKYNFGIVNADTLLGRLGKMGLAALSLKSSTGNVDITEYFSASDGYLHPSRPLKLFMITTNPSIAISDCILYAVPFE